ncbi:MAG: hypothetical protein V1659_03840 [Candidatus Woesearchaeota archaeon]
MDDTRYIICEGCRKPVLISDIKYVLKGETRKGLCTICRNKQANSEKEKGLAKEKQKVPYFCARCKYKFLHSPVSGSNLRCPYCGKSDKVLNDNPSSAENLLKDSEGFGDRNF